MNNYSDEPNRAPNNNELLIVDPVDRELIEIYSKLNRDWSDRIDWREATSLFHEAVERLLASGTVETEGTVTIENVDTQEIDTFLFRASGCRGSMSWQWFLFERLPVDRTWFDGIRTRANLEWMFTLDRLRLTTAGLRLNQSILGSTPALLVVAFKARKAEISFGVYGKNRTTRGSSNGTTTDSSTAVALAAATASIGDITLKPIINIQNVIHSATPAAPSAEGQPTSPTDRPEWEKMTCDARMESVWKENKDCFTQSAKWWGDMVGCDLSTVKKTPTWKAMMRARAEERKSRRR